MQSTQFIHIHKSHFLLHDLSYGGNKSYLEVKLEDIKYHIKAFILNGLDFFLLLLPNMIRRRGVQFQDLVGLFWDYTLLCPYDVLWNSSFLFRDFVEAF